MKFEIPVLLLGLVEIDERLLALVEDSRELEALGGLRAGQRRPAVTRHQLACECIGSCTRAHRVAAQTGPQCGRLELALERFP